MSKTIDERVVSMEFDNKQFESNVRTSLSTLDKLKQSLKLDGAAKGFESISKAAKNVDMSPLSSGLDTVKSKFSALEVVAITALANITNSAVNAGKSLVKSLTLDQITAGWNKYEQKTASVQTLVNSTGKSVDAIDGYLRKLMWFSDETSYGFSDMHSALSTMVSSGGDIEKLIPMIEGVANATAYAGKGASEFGHIMKYAITQAYSTNAMMIKDWQTIENMTVNSKQLQEALIKAGEAVGTIKKGEVTLSNFRESLKDKWLNKEVQEMGFGYFAKVTEDIYEGLESGKFEGYTEGLEKIGKKYGEVAYRAAASSREAKTFTEAIDATKDAVSTGWSNTFELIFGDYDQAKKLWTDFSDRLWDIFASGGEERNEVLRAGMSSNWSKLIRQLDEAGVSADKFNDTLAETLKQGGWNVDVIANKYGSLQEAFQQGIISSYWLEKALKSVNGQAADFSKIQNELKKNDRGDQVKEAQKALKQLGYDLGEFGKSADGVDGKFGKMTESAIKAFQTANGLKATGIVDSKTISALDKATQGTTEWSDSIHDLISNIGELGGREYLIQSFRNLFDGIGSIVGPIKEAFHDTFNIDSSQILNFTKRLEDLTSKIKISDDTATKLKTTFKGFFSVGQQVGKVAGGVLKTGFNVLGKVLKPTGGLVLNLTSKLGDALARFSEWVDKNKIISKVFDGINATIDKAPAKIQEWISSISNLPAVKKALEWMTATFDKISEHFGNLFSKDGFAAVGDFFKNSFATVKNWFDSFKNLDIVKRNVERFKTTFSNVFKGLKDSFPRIGESIRGFVDKLKSLDGISLENIRQALSAFGELVSSLWSNVREKFRSIGTAVSGFADDVKIALDNAGICIESFKTAIGSAFEWIKEKLSNVKWGNLLAIGIGTIFTLLIRDIAKSIEKITAVFKPFGEITSNINNVLTEFQNVLKAYENKINSEALKNVAIAIAILATSLIALAQVDTQKLWDAIGILGALAGGIILLMGAMSVFSKFAGRLNQISAGAILLSIGGALLMMSGFIKNMKGVSDSDIEHMTRVLVAFTIVISFLTMVTSKFSAGDLAKVGAMATGVGVALLLIAESMKVIAGIPSESIDKATGFVVLIGGLILALTGISKYAKTDVSKVGSMMLKIGAALLLMVAFIKLVSGIEIRNVAKGIAIVAALEYLIIGLVAISKLSGEHADKAGSMVMKVGAALALIAITMKIVAGMSTDDLKKGVQVVAALGGIIVALIAVSKLSGEYADKAGAMIIKVGAAFAIITAVIAIMSLIDPADLWRGVGIIAALSACIAGLIFVTKYAQLTKESKGAIIALTVALGILAGAIGVLSLLDTKSVLAASGALSLVIGMFALLMKAVSALNTQGTQFSRSVATLTLLISVVAFIGVIISSLAKQNPESVLGATVGLSLLMLSLTTCLAIINKMGAGNPSGAVGTLVILLAVTAGLGLIISALKDLDPGQAIGIAAALSILIGSLSACCLLLTLSSSIGPMALAAVAVMTLVTYAMAGILHLLQDLDPTQAIGIAAALAVLIGSLSACCLLLSLSISVGPMALAAVAVMTLVTYAMAGILHLLQDLDPTQAIGVTAALSTLILSLSAACILLEVAGLAGPAALLGVAALAVLIAGIGGLIVGIGALATEFPQVEEFLNKGIPLLMQIGSAIGEFFGTIISSFAEEVISILPAIGEALSGFMTNISGFINGATAFDSSKMEAIRTLAEAILILTGANLLDGINRFWGGKSALEEFGAQLVPFGEDIAAFSETVSGKIDAEAVEAAANAGAMLAQLASTLNSSGGLIQKIFGEKDDLKGVGEKLQTFGSTIVAFSSTVSSKGAINKEAIQKACDATSLVVDLANTLPSDNGWLGKVFGDKDTIDGFGSKLTAYANSLNTFCTTLDGTKFDIGKIEEACTATGKIVELAETLPQDPGWFASVFGGGTDLEKFGEQIASLGTYLSTFNGSIQDVDVEKMSMAVANIQLIAGIASGLNGIDFDDMENLGKSFGDLGSANIQAFINALTTAGPQLNTAGANAIQQLINGITSKQSEANQAAANVVTSSVTAASNACNGTYGIGQNFVEGFISGIDSLAGSAVAAAANMASGALAAIQAALQIHSPSRKMIEMGENTDMGFIIGLKRMASDVYEAGGEVGQAAKSGLQDKLSKNGNKLTDFLTDTPNKISAVLELDTSSAEDKASKFWNSIGGGQSFELGGDISNAFAQNNQNESKTASGSTAAPSYSFTQNNYSPKALSRIDIYRQTKNQFSGWIFNDRIDGGFNVEYDEIKLPSGNSLWKRK